MDEAKYEDQASTTVKGKLNKDKLKMSNAGDVYVNNRAARRRKPITDPRFTSKTARMRSKEETEARRNRVLRVEKGEQERIVKKKDEKNNAK